MEVMGLHLPGASFVNPNAPLRDALTREAAPPGHAVDQDQRQLHADRRNRRQSAGQLHRCAARHGRLHQPHPARPAIAMSAGII
jgi:phosphogluconate dehydratase